MVQVLTYEQIDRGAWSALVRESETGNWFQSPAAFDFFASMPELFKPFAIAVTGDGLPVTGDPASEAGTTNKERLRGVCVGYVTIEKNAIKQFMMRRAIIVGGPALANDVASEEVQFLMEAVRKGLVIGNRLLVNAPIYIETRNFNDYSRWRGAFEKAGFEYVPHLNFHVDTSSVEVVEANLGKSRKRDIRTSFRDGAVVIEQPTIEQVREYYAILENLYRTKVKTPLFPLSFFEALYHHPDGRFILVGLPNAEGKMEIIGGTVCVAFNRTKTQINTSDEAINIDKQDVNKKEGLLDTCSIPNSIDHQSACEQAPRQPNAQSCSIDSVAQTLSNNPSQKNVISDNCEKSEKNIDGVVYEWFVSGRDGEWKSIFPSSVATYAGIKYAAEHGCARFDMMGAGKPDEAYGVRDFKARFGGREVEYGRFLCIAKPVLYKIGVLGVKILKKR